MVDSLIETFLQIPKADDSKELRKLFNVANEVVKGFRAQGTDGWFIYHVKNYIHSPYMLGIKHCGKVTFSSLRAYTSTMKKANAACGENHYLSHH